MNEVPVLQARNLTRVFVQGSLRVAVLKGLDFTLEPGEQVAIVGASGSGKSTLLHCLGGLDRPTEGTVIVEGQNLARLRESDRCRLRNRALGFVYQFHHLLGEFTALENVAMPLLVRNVGAREAGEKAAELLARVGLGHRLRHKPSELSGGERQRAAIARALVTEPRCILADEPTGNLDRTTAVQVTALMLEMQQASAASLVVATHDPELAAGMDRTLHLYDGLLSPG